MRCIGIDEKKPKGGNWTQVIQSKIARDLSDKEICQIKDAQKENI